MTALVFGSFFESVEWEADRSQVAFATIHAVGSLSSVVLSYLFVRIARSLGPWPVVIAILIGRHVTVTYNLGLLTEQILGNRLEQYGSQSLATPLVWLG